MTSLNTRFAFCVRALAFNWSAWASRILIVWPVLLVLTITIGTSTASAAAWQIAVSPGDEIGGNGETEPPKKDKTAGDPVILSTGKLQMSETDMTIRGRGIDFSLTRSYRNGSRSSMHMGSNWDHNWNQFIVLEYELKKKPGYAGPPDPLIPFSRAGSKVQKAALNLPGEPITQGWTVYEKTEPTSLRQSQWLTANLNNEIWNLKVGGAYYYDGRNRIDVFNKPEGTSEGFINFANGLWNSPPGYTSKLRSYPFAGSGAFTMPEKFVLRHADGRKLTFAVVDIDPQVVGRIYRLSKIEDRDGNAITLSYKPLAAQNDSYPNGIVYKGLDKITDTLGREITFEYATHTASANDIRNNLFRVTDFAGRSVQYGFSGDFSQEAYLTQVKTPAITGTSTGNDFPSGRTTIFSYSVIYPGDVDAQLTTIVNPNEYQDGAGSLVPSLVNEYASGRVIRQWVGGANGSGVPSGGLYRFLYDIQPAGQTISHGNGVYEASKTLVIDPNGNVSLSIFDANGNSVLSWVFTGRVDPALVISGIPISSLVSVDPSAPNGQTDSILSSAPGYVPPLRSGDPSSYVTRQYFDANGHVTESVDPASHHRYTYYSGTDAFQQGNLIVEERLPVPDDGSAPLISVNVYEPFGGMLRASYPPIAFDPNHIPANGGPSGPDPARYSTKYIYDYQEGAIGGSSLEAEASTWVIDVDQVSLDSVYAQHGITNVPVTADDQRGDLNGDGVESDRFGRVVLIEEPTANVWADPSVPNSIFVPQAIETRIIYNAYGLPITRIDERGNATNIYYHPENDPDGDGIPIVGGGSSASGQQGGGFQKREESPAGVAFELGYDPLGRPTSTTYFRGTTSITATREYNALGDLVQETNAVGEVEQFLYDWNGNLVHQRIEHRVPGIDTGGGLTGTMVPGPSGGFIDQFYDYDIQGNLVKEDIQVDAQTRSVTKHRYDKVGNLAMTLNPMRGASEPSNYTTHVYDELGRLWSTTRGGRTSDFSALMADEDIPERGGLTNSPDVSTTYHYYDGANNLVKSVDGEGKEKTLTVDRFGRTERQTDPLGNYTEYTLDASGQQTEVFSYDSSGALLAHIKMAYDELGRVFQTDSSLFQIGAVSVPLFEGPLTPSDGFVTTRVLYDPSGNSVQVTEDDGGSLFQTYDADHRVISRKDPRGNEALYAHDGTENVNRIATREVDDAGTLQNTVVSWSFYDYADRRVATLDSLGNVHRYAYDSRGLLMYQSDARSVNFTTDVASLDLYSEHTDLSTVASINLEGNTTTFTIDDRGLITATRSYFRDDGLGGQPIDLAAAGDGVVTLLSSYDLNGRLRSRTDDEGNTTTYQFDALNRLVKTIRADQSEANVSYDKRDLVTAEVTPRGDSIVSLRDDGGRVITRLITYADQSPAETEVFDYDGLNRVVLALNSEASVARNYDSLGRLVRESIDGDITEMGYDGSGSMVHLKYPSGRVIERNFDISGFLTGIIDQGSPGWSVDFDYEGGRLEAVRYGNGTETLLDYDAVGRPTLYKVQHYPTATTIEHRGTEWDANSNRSARVDYVRTRRFDYEYDSLNRLAVSKRGDGIVVEATTSYSLDGSGNRATVLGGLSNGLTAMLPAATYASVNKYSSSPPYADIQYDLNGNLVQRLESNLADFQYDYRNLMVEFFDQGTGEQWNYGYDAFGRRVSKTRSGFGAINYRYVGFELCEEQDGISSTTSTYVYGDGIDELLSVRRANIDSYYHTDFQGNVLAITDTAGLPSEQYEYDDYGLVRNASDLALLVGVGASGNSHFYTGRPFDWESQLYYVRARMLDPRLGRFTTRDPLGGWADPLSLGNGYTYCGNNPWTCVDPAGTKAKKKGKRRRGRLSAQFAKSRFRKARAKARSLLRKLNRAATKEIRNALKEGRDPNFTSALENFAANIPKGLKGTISYEAYTTRTGPDGRPLEIPEEVITGFSVSLSYAVEVELPAMAKSEPPGASPQGNAGSGGGDPGSGGGVGSALVEVAWGLSAMFIPGVGEAQDIAILVSSEASWVDRTLSGVSLVANFFTGGLAPNYGSAMKAGKGFGALMGALGRGGDDIVDLARAAKGAMVSSRWGRNRLVKELHDQGFALDRSTRSGGGLLYRNSKTGAEMRIMPKPRQRFRDDPSAKHASDYYYRARSGPDQKWGPHTSIPDGD